MGTLQDSDHMVQKPPYWDANCPLGHLKQRKFRLTSFVLDVPVRNLRPSMADLYHVITILQRAHQVKKQRQFRVDDPMTSA